MVQNISVQQKQMGYEFNSNTWKYLLQEAKIAGAMSAKEIKMIDRMPVAKIAAATAYFADCPNPDQIAVLRIIDILSANRNERLYWHRPDQTIRERILPALYYPCGSPEVIETANTLLELISLNDHLADRKDDRKNGKYNPLNTRISSFYNNRKALLEKLECYPDIKDKYQALFKTDITIINFWKG